MPPLFDLPDSIMATLVAALGVVLGVFSGMFGHLYKRLSDLEANQRDLWQLREGDAITKRALGDHIDVLEDHIWKRKPPPPPSRPPGC
jgi:hypothetical protein